MIYHNGTTGSEHKFDRWTEAQQKQNEYAVREVAKERYLPINRSPEMDAAQERRKALQQREAALQAGLGDVLDWVARWRSKGIDVPGVTVALDEAVKAEQVKVLASQMEVGIEINNLQGAK